MSLLSRMLREVADLADAPGTIRAHLTIMEEHIMAELADLREAVADEIVEALRTIPDAEELRLAVERAESAEQARSNIEDAFGAFRQRVVGLTGEIRSEGLFGQAATTTTTEDVETTTTTEDTDTETTTEDPETTTTTVAPEDAPVEQPNGEEGTGFEPVRV